MYRRITWCQHCKRELIADAVSIMIQSNFGIEITDSRKRHLKSHYDSLKKEMESEIGHEMSAEEMSNQLMRSYQIQWECIRSI